MIEFSLSFTGNNADDHQLDFYDAAQAMLGFQRSLAITTHLVLNGEVITQAPSLKNAKILAAPPEEGSWKIPALITAIAVGGYNLGTASKDTPLGHLMYSAYDYVISETMGFHVDYEKSLGQQYKELQKDSKSGLPILEQSQFDSAIEKCEFAVREMHRPIIKSESATMAQIFYRASGSQVPFEHPLNRKTFENINETTRDENIEEIRGLISSYNINTYKGRLFIPDEQRPLPFELAKEAQTTSAVRKITNSLSMNAVERFDSNAQISCLAFKNKSKTGRLKSYYVIEVL